ncbi:MAG: hypothetical protein V1735_00325 [Nanoarchaeota archaeon]
MGFAVRKVPGGKLVRVDVAEGKAVITGDFFLYPEELIKALEACLSPKLGKEELVTFLDAVLAQGELIGCSAEDIAEVYLEALR